MIMGFFATLFGCGQTNKSETKKVDKLEEITSRTDISEGFSDIFLSIESDTKTDSSHIYVAKGFYKGITVGLQFEVKSNMKNGLTQDGQMNSQGGFIKNAIKTNSIGKESDELVKALGELYSFPTTSLFTKQTITSTVFSLNQKIANLDKPDYYKFKLFFEDDSEDLYSELFFNINTAEKIIELHEKDQEYRQPLIKVFTK
jgi:hypothetical protein